MTYCSPNVVRNRTVIIAICLPFGQDIGVFDYYKELIGFKRCGEPSRLMKYIDPREVRIKRTGIFEGIQKKAQF